MTQLNITFHYMLLLWGILYFITQSSIFGGVRMLVLAKARQLGMLLYCPACTGFWIGLLLGGSRWFPLELFTDTGSRWTLTITYVLTSGLASMALGAIWGAIFGQPHVFQTEYAHVVAVIKATEPGGVHGE